MAAMKIAHHIKDGAKEMYEIDAKSAVARFPKEWSFEPWGGGKQKPADENKPAIVIPEGWKELPGPERIALARQVGKKGNFGADKADEAIQAYLDENKPVEE